VATAPGSILRASLSIAGCGSRSFTQRLPNNQALIQYKIANGGCRYSESRGSKTILVAARVSATPWRVWTAHQLREAFPWDTAPRFLLRDRIFGQEFAKQLQAMGIEQVLSTPRSPWQRAYVERKRNDPPRVPRSPDRFNETSLRRHVQGFTDYYHRTRTHLSLKKDGPEPRPVQPPGAGQIIAIPEVGGLHHRYERHAA